MVKLLNCNAKVVINYEGLVMIKMLLNRLTNIVQPH
jgi:hypothetical protein